MIKCTYCHVEKPATREFFAGDKKGRHGLSSRCLECRKLLYGEKARSRAIKHYQDNREKKLEYIKNYNQEHKQEYLAKQKEYREARDKEEVSRYNKAYQEANRERLVEQKRAYFAQNKELWRKWRNQNKDRYNENMRRYAQNNRGKYVIYHQRRKTRRLSLEDNFTEKMWERCKTAFNDCCAYCGNQTKLSHDHFIALSKGGEYTMNNIVPACKNCNSSKRDADFFEWYPKHKHYSKEREQRIIKHLNYKQVNIQQLALTL